MKLALLILGAVALLGAGPNLAQALDCSDATILGLEISGEPLAPLEIVNQVAQDVMLIRIRYPEVAGITVFPDWIPGDIHVALTEDAYLDYQTGTFAAFDSLTSHLGDASIVEYQFITSLYLSFEDCYHPDFLAEEYAGLEGVRHASANLVGGDGSDIISTQVGYYTFKHGYGDCPSGCMNNHFWDFHVDGGAVTLLNEYSNTLSGIDDVPSVESVESFSIWPNPLNPSTTIRFTLGAPSPVSVRVYDVGGNLVRDLASGVFQAGEHVIKWGGETNAGLTASSGVYFCTLEGPGWAQTRKMVVLK